MKRYSLYFAFLAFSAFLAFLASCGSGDIIDLSNNSEKWGEILEIADGLTEEGGLISRCKNKPESEGCNIPTVSSSSEDDPSIPSSSSANVITEPSSSSNTVTTPSSSSIVLSSSSSTTITTPSSSSVVVSSSSVAASSSSVAASSSSVAASSSSVVVSSSSVAPSSSSSRPSSSSVAPSSSSSRPSSSSVAPSSSSAGSTGGDGSGSIDKPIEDGKIGDLGALNGEVYLKGKAGTGNNHNNIKLKCSGNQGSTASYADCYPNGDCGTSTEISNFGQNPGYDGMLSDTLFKDCDGNDPCSYFIKLTFTKVGSSYPTCNLGL